MRIDILKMPKKITRKNNRSYTLKDDRNRFFYPNEYMKFFDNLVNKQKHTIKCLINTGARINEFRNVKVNDIDFTNKRIVLRITKTKAKKGESRGRIRTIPISSEFNRYLKGYCTHKKEEDYLDILSTPASNIGLKKACIKAGISDYYNFSVHTLRKTLETWLMALGVDSLALTAHLGHDIRTAAQHYVSPDVFSFDEKKKMRLIIGDLYER